MKKKSKPEQVIDCLREGPDSALGIALETKIPNGEVATILGRLAKSGRIKEWGTNEFLETPGKKGKIFILTSQIGQPW